MYVTYIIWVTKVLWYLKVGSYDDSYIREDDSYKRKMVRKKIDVEVGKQFVYGWEVRMET